MINNRGLIEPLLEFPHEDIFYFVQVLQRKKDHPELGNNSRLIKAYFINSKEKLEKQWDEMVKLSEVFNARLMINLNPRNYKKAGYHLLQKIANSMANNDFYNLHKAYTSVCGEYHSEIDKRWLVDIDDTDIPNMEYIAEYIGTLQGAITNKSYNILAKIPSKSGWSLITNPFNLELFNKRFSKIEVHKNNPVNLYIPQ